MSKRSKLICSAAAAFVGTVVFGAILAAPKTSHALRWLRTACISGTTDPAPGNSLSCIVPQSDHLPINDVTTAFLHISDTRSGGYTPPGEFEAKACLSYPNSPGGYCGAKRDSVSYTAPGRTHVQLNLNAWDDTYAHQSFAYVWFNKQVNTTAVGVYIDAP